MKTLITALLLLTNVIAYSQIYGGMSGNNKGIAFHFGAMLLEKVDVHTTFTHRVSNKANIPMSWNFNAGPVLTLMDNGYHQLYFSPYAGASYVWETIHHRVNEEPPYLITKEQGMFFNYGANLEIKGGEISFFLGANKSKHLYVSFGTKFYPFSE